MAIAIWSILLGYLALGIVALIWLMVAGLARFDEGAAHAPLRVKLLLMPGILALWPVLLLRSLGVKPPEDREHAAHRQTEPRRTGDPSHRHSVSEGRGS